MAITVAGIGAFTSQVTGTLTPGLPAGWQPGDIWIAVVAVRGSPMWPGSGGAGWSQIASPLWAGPDNALRAYWRRAQSGDTAPVGESDGNSCGRIIGFRGCIATGTPYEGLTSGADGTADTTLGPTAGVSVTLGSLIVVAAAGDGDDGNPRYSSPSMSGVSGLTEQFDHGSTAGLGQAIGCWTAVPNGVGTTGGFSATQAFAMRDAWMALALIPAPTAPVSQAVIIG